MNKSYDTAVYIGRFQPFHNGHLALLRHALSIAPRCVVVLGSAFHARTPFNPFTWQERRDVMLGALSESERARVEFLPVRDYYNEPRWAKVVREAVQAGKPERGIALVGHFKDDSSSYLRAFPGWHLEHMERQGSYNGIELREICFADTLNAVARLATQVPPSTLNFVKSWLGSASFDALREEWQTLEQDKEKWACAPYAPVFVTADAVVICAEHVLLIERGRNPGRGLYALPGGFIDQNETIEQSALRELEEETGLTLSVNELREKVLFDHPRRSVRGRTITQAFRFDLSAAEPPAMAAGDDAAAATWFPIASLVTIEDRLFDDHFMILDRFFGLLKD